MVAVTLQSNIAEITARLSDVGRRQVPFATQRAINDTAFEVMRLERKSIPVYMDNPTPFTQRAVRVLRARDRRRPTAYVYLVRESVEYLERLIEGGFERPKGRALLSPVTPRRGVVNRYGNIPRTFTKRTKANRKRYFFGVPRGRQGQAYAGVWERYGRGGRRIRQLVHFDSDGRTVRAQWPFYRIGVTHAYRYFPRAFTRRFRQALATAR